MAEEKTIYVRGLPPDTQKEDITEVFEKYGRLRDVYIPLDYYTKRQKDFCYVKYSILTRFERIEEAEEALEKSRDLVIARQRVVVEWAKGRRKDARDMRHQEERRRYGRSRSRDRYRRDDSRDRYRRNDSRDRYRRDDRRDDYDSRRGSPRRRDDSPRRRDRRGSPRRDDRRDRSPRRESPRERPNRSPSPRRRDESPRKRDERSVSRD